MGLLAELLRPQPRADASINDESAWTTWSSVGGTAASGIYVDPLRALQNSAVWACTRLIAESIAMMPLIVYRRLPGGAKERATGHPLYSLLHDQPNQLQTAFVFKRTAMVQALLYGNAYARIVAGPRGPVDQLEPIHADRCRAEPLKGGGFRYLVRGDDGIERPVNREDVFHLPGLSVDGISGLSLVQYARESIGVGLAAEGYSARFFSQGARPGGVLKYPGRLSKETAKRVRESWIAQHAGQGNWHAPAVLEDGLDWQMTGINNEDAQLIALLDWSTADVARFFNVPLHMVQLMTKSTSWGSGIEEMGIEFVMYTLLPWVTNWEQLIKKDLILAPETYFAEFLLESVMRAKLLDRYNAYAIGRQQGWLSRNDVRRLENMNPIPGGDDYLTPLNMEKLDTTGAGEASGGAAQPAPTGHYYLLLYEAAARVIRKEVAAMRKAARRCAGDPAAWQAAVDEFYADHTDFVRSTMGMTKMAAELYVAAQREALLARGAAVIEDWESRRVGELVALAMGAGQA